MSDEKKVVNPFDESNFLTGGGIWDGKTVTITGAKTVDELISDGQGNPVMDFKDPSKQSHFRGLVLTGIADDAENERREQYSAGSLIPTDDGEGFRLPPGPDGRVSDKPVRFHESSGMAEFSRRLGASGFDVSKLLVDGKLKVSALTGARFVMRGQPKKDKEGKQKVSKKGYDEFRFFPEKFVGYREGLVAPAPVSNVLRDKAISTVVTVLGENGGTLGRAEMVRKISAALAKDADANKVIALISRDEFHKDVPWTRDGTSYRLS